MLHQPQTSQTIEELIVTATFFKTARTQRKLILIDKRWMKYKTRMMGAAIPVTRVSEGFVGLVNLILN